MSTALSQFDQLKADIVSLVAPVKTLRVTDFKSGQVAAETLNEVKNYLRQLEKKRVELTGPLNAEVKRINAYAKTIEAPLEEAEAFIKRQMAAFEDEQRKLRLAELAKIEAERKRAEAELKAKQDAERVEAAARADAQAAAAALFGLEEATPVDPVAELETKHQMEAAELKHEAAAKTFDVEQMGIKNAALIWKCELIDISLVPDEFLNKSLNTKAVLEAARAGRTDVPGVRLYQETSIRSGTNSYVPRKAIEERG